MPTNIAWEKDLLNRKKEGEFLFNYLFKRYENNKKSSFVLNINAKWGFGKTYFLTNLAKELEVNKHPVVYFDAWKNDYTDNPLLAFMAELNTSLDEYFIASSKAKSFFKDAYKTSKNILLPIIAKKLTGHAVSEMSELFKKEEQSAEESNKTNNNSELEDGISSIMSRVSEIALSEHKTVQNSIKVFKEQMQRLLKHIDKNMTSKKLPMFILIDELDRCRPNYAIELLENIKHIFDIPGIVFIVATDSNQLSHSINAIYGDKFASEKYLKRFFHQEYNLIKPDSYDFANYLFEIHNISNNKSLFSPLEEELYTDKNINVELFSLYASFFNLSLRDQEQVAIVLSAIIITWQDNKSIHLGYLLILIMLKQKKDSFFYTFNEDNSFKDKDIKIIGMNTSIYCYSNEFTDRFSPYVKKNYYVIDMINFYLSTLNKNMESLSKIKTKNIVAQNILNKIRRELPNSYNSHDGPPKYNLNIYSELVLRAGQLL